MSTQMQVVSPTSCFAYKSIRLHDQVVSPTQSQSIRLHLSRFAYTYKSKCFVKMDEHHCLQFAEESYLTVFPVKFLDIITIMFAGINMFWARLRLILALAQRLELKSETTLTMLFTKFVIKNRTDTLKIDINSFFTITNCRIAGSHRLTLCMNFKFMCLSAC